MGMQIRWREFEGKEGYSHLFNILGNIGQSRQQCHVQTDLMVPADDSVGLVLPVPLLTNGLIATLAVNRSTDSWTVTVQVPPVRSS